WSAGLNYPAFSIFDLSMGYSYRFNGNPAGTLSGLGLGFGLNWKDFSLDYSYRNYDELGETHKLSFLWRFVMPGVKETEVPVTKKTGTLKWKLAGGDERGMMYSVEYKPEGKIVDRITMILPFTPEGDAIETWVEENVAGFRIEGIGGEILYFVNVRNDLGIQNLFVRYELRGIPPDCRAYFLKEKKDLPLKNENGRTLLETTALASFVIYRASPEPAPEGEAETKVRSAGEVYSEKGAGLMEKGEWSAAAECFRQAVEIDGKTQYFSSLGFCLGMRYFREKRYPEAKKAFEKVLRLEPGHRESLERLREIEKLVPKDGTVE
ncbi:MAG TPA: tetratricopeptide repeat protein, partial [bacterium]|nr:tetratricopeptide repeat protein [bacterium]